jgi:hypothetical protein
MRDALEMFYQQKVLVLQERLLNDNFPWTVKHIFDLGLFYRILLSSVILEKSLFLPELFLSWKKTE